MDLTLDQIVSHTLRTHKQIQHSHKLVLIQGHAEFIIEKAVFLELPVEVIFAVRKQGEKQRGQEIREK